MKIVSYEHIQENEQNVGFFRCFLDKKEWMIDLEYYTFFKWIEEKDKSLEEYEKKFDTWEEFIEDLEEIGYDIKNQMNLYLEYLDNNFEDLISESIYTFQKEQDYTLEI